jgi:exodeoxyribonuclease VII small subunit
MEEKPSNFEQNLSRLNEIVSLLDSGEKPLEDMVKLYEEGMKLAVTLREELNNAEQKIITISKNFKAMENN